MKIFAYIMAILFIFLGSLPLIIALIDTKSLIESRPDINKLEIKTVPCYDRAWNKIDNLSCENKVYTYQNQLENIIIELIFGMFATVVGIVYLRDLIRS